MKHNAVIYDVLYGFIPITEWEEKIINSPFFQRLRWIKQLGFSNYIFPGAEHNRFAHVIGVMNSMEQMVRALDIAVPQNQLFDRRSTSKAALLHKSLRIAALLHDIGTFPFSHAIEYAYMRHGNDSRVKSQGRRSKLKDLPNNHEHLGSFIIKNTRYEGGITQILEEYGLDVQLISDIIKGDSPYLVANQLMHSDLDADRMDYLLRDSHYTGIKYGQFDREYILANLQTYDAGDGQMAFGVRENAVHAVEDFLIARFGWYSQVIKNPGSAKFDIMSSHIAQGLLERDLLFQFHDLLDFIEKRDERFFWWNDLYFMNRCQEIHIGKLLGKKADDARLAELIEMLLYRKAPKTVHHPLFQHRILKDDSGTGTEKEKLIAKIQKTVAEMQKVLESKGTGKEWILVDIPEKDVVFTKGLQQIVKKRSQDNLLKERDPVKVVSRRNGPSLLVELDNTLMKHMSGFMNFVPSVYGNHSAIELLKNHGLIPSSRK
ncbi:MAG: HD domain-containing protein [Bdellovibrionales bacterium]|nr:HD domain-containing protein [Bdellovibrionales bacterium]